MQELNSERTSKNDITTIVDNVPEVVEANPVIVFDIDSTICKELLSSVYNTEALKKFVEKAKLINPDSPIGFVKHYDADYYCIYQCLPHLDSLFNYLIDHKVRIVFFSAGLKYRNVALLDQIISQSLGEETYLMLKMHGQFEIFSRNDLTVSQYSYKGEGEYTKDLNKVLYSGESQKNSILVEDDPSHVQYFQHPFIFTIDLGNRDTGLESKHGFNSFAKNSIYYLLGLFMEYFEKEQYSSLKLKEGFRKIHKDRGMQMTEEYKEFRYLHPEATDPFVREMIYNGLDEVKKIHEEAVLYGKEIYFKEYDEL